MGAHLFFFFFLIDVNGKDRLGRCFAVHKRNSLLTLFKRDDMNL